MRRWGQRAALGVVALGVALSATACDSLPWPDPSSWPSISVPEISIPSLPSLPAFTPEPDPTDEAQPEPPTPTETSAAPPAPEPTDAPVVTPPPPSVTPSPSTTPPAPIVTPSVTPSRSITPSPSVSPSLTADPEPGDDVSTMPWPWLLLGAAVAALLIVWARTAYLRGAWDKRLNAARADVEWFEGPLAAHILAQPTPQDADVAWQTGRPQVVDIERALYDLHGDAKTETRAAKAADGQRAVRELTAAFDAETSTAMEHSDEASLRAGRAAVEAARAQVRAWLAATAKG